MVLHRLNLSGRNAEYNIVMNKAVQSVNQANHTRNVDNLEDGQPNRDRASHRGVSIIDQ